jgi:hypothetical protein
MKTDTYRKNHPDPKRAKLVELLEQLNLSVVSFDQLRSDAYEKHVAKHSIHELEQVYLTLLKPGEACEANQKKFPRWRSGKHNGKLPSVNTLLAVKQRMMADYLANDLIRLGDMLETVRNRSSGLPREQQAEVFNVILMVMGEEMLRAKGNGKDISQNLPVVDRLLRAAAIRFRERQGDRRLGLVENSNKTQASKVKLEWKKFQHKTGKPAPAAESAGSEADVEADNARTDELIEQVFGKNPYAKENQN